MYLQGMFGSLCSNSDTNYNYNTNSYLDYNTSNTSDLNPY